MPGPLFTTAQLEIAVGGADKLRQLSGARDANDPKYVAFVSEVKAAAEGDVYSIINPAFNISDPALPAAVFLQQHAIAIGAYYAHRKGAGGLEMPDGIDKGHQDALQVLGEVRSGVRSLGTDQAPAAGFPSQQVDMEIGGAGWTRKTWGGYC